MSRTNVALTWTERQIAMWFLEMCNEARMESGKLILKKSGRQGEEQVTLRNSVFRELGQRLSRTEASGG